MNLQLAIYKALQDNCGDHQEVWLEDLLNISCGYRHHLKLRGENPVRKESPTQILLREIGAQARAKISSYLRGCFKKRYREGFVQTEGDINVRVDGFIDDVLVEIYLESTLFFSTSKAPRRGVLLAAAKATLTGARGALLIVMDRDKQDWAFWQVSGDLEGASATLLKEAHYINSLQTGDAIPVGMASERTCSRCPFTITCSVGPTEDPPPYQLEDLVVTSDADSRMSVEGYLWSLNMKPHSRATKCIHPSEISTTDCDLKIAHGLLGTEERSSIDPKLRRIFDMGHAVHDVIQSAIKWAVPEFQAEVPVKHSDLKIRGHCDGTTSDIHGVEIKSIGSKGFEKLTSAKTDHKKQATVYGAILELKDIDYIYVNKETGDLGVFKTPVDRSLWHQIATRAARIISEVENNRLPEGTDKDYKCRSCKYAWTCKPEVLKKGGFQASTNRFQGFGR